jgi:hypothetical protein
MVLQQWLEILVKLQLTMFMEQEFLQLHMIKFILLTKPQLIKNLVLRISLQPLK